MSNIHRVGDIIIIIKVDKEADTIFLDNQINNSNKSPAMNY